jgi:DNA-binding NtrC family response regulator
VPPADSLPGYREKILILVISANWQTCALLAAQVGETCGCDVVSAPGVNEALALVKVAETQPALLVVDADQQMLPEDVERLMTALPDTPLALIASALRQTAFDPLCGRCAVYLVRPVSIGGIAQAVAQALENARATPGDPDHWNPPTPPDRSTP